MSWVPNLPEWMPGASDRVEPPAGKKTNGFDPNERPPAQYFNWFWWLLSVWLRRLQSRGAEFDIVVGSSAQVSAGVASHTVDGFVEALADNSRVLLLDGTHTLTRNEDITETGISLVAHSRAAILAMSTFSLTLSGDQIRTDLYVDGAGSGDIVVSGDHEVLSFDLSASATDAIADSGAENDISWRNV